MKKPISITTKKGDEGESYLANGVKLLKNSLVFEVLGSVDELNSNIGVVVAHLKLTELTDKKMLVGHLENIQSNLYLLSGILANAPNIRFSKTKLIQIEKLGDTLQNKMAEGWTTKFLYPGGSSLGAYLDVARSVCRRCERVLVAYSMTEEINPVILQYINRLSDFLFIVRCYANLQLGVAEKQFSK